MRDEVVAELVERLGRDPALAGTGDAELEESVRVGAAEIAAATCRWLELLAEFVVRGGWADAGARSPSAWLSWALGIAPSTAREHVRVGLRLRECPLVRDRFRAGTLSYSKVRAITRVATPETEAMLLEWADSAPAHVLERVVRDADRVHRGAQGPALDDLGVRRRWRDDGSLEVVARLDPIAGAALEQSLERLLDTDVRDDAVEAEDAAEGRVPRSVREGDVLVRALQSMVELGPDDTSGEDRHLLVLHADASDVADALDEAAEAVEAVESAGEVVAPPDASARRTVLVRDTGGRPRGMPRRLLGRLACGGRLRLDVAAAGRPVGHGRQQRDPDARLRRLLRTRDGGCRFPGCGATRFVHAHHVHWWSRGGPTDLDNLVLCSAATTTASSTTPGGRSSRTGRGGGGSTRLRRPTGPTASLRHCRRRGVCEVLPRKRSRWWVGRTGWRPRRPTWHRRPTTGRGTTTNWRSRCSRSGSMVHSRPLRDRGTGLPCR